MNFVFSVCFQLLTGVLGLLVLIIISLIISIYWYATKQNNIPPGPIGLPVVGYLPFLGKKPHITFSKLREKYGPIFSVYLGSKLVIILNDFKAIKEAFVTYGDIFSERPLENPFNPNNIHKIVGLNGYGWKEHRRFTLTTLKNFGVGKSETEDRLMEEIHHFTNYLTTLDGTAVDFTDYLGKSVSNNVIRILFGRRFEYDDPQFTKMMQANDECIRFGNAVSSWIFFPHWIKCLPGFSKYTGHRFVKKYNHIIEHEFVRPLVDEHKITQDNAKEDYVNSFIEEQREKNSTDSIENIFTDESLYGNALALLGAGTETTHTTLRWIIIYMTLYPKIQHRIQNEIDSTIGRDRDPSFDDRLRTPLTEATILEVGRIKYIVTLNIPHTNFQEGCLGKYRIPKNSYILSNLWHVHNDPKLWGDPENFNPERFFNGNDEVVKPEYYIPFSIGKRYCVGETLARTSIYLYFTSMMQKFTFSAPPGISMNDEENFGLNISPKLFKPLITLRKESQVEQTTYL